MYNFFLKFEDKKKYRLETDVYMYFRLDFYLYYFYLDYFIFIFTFPFIKDAYRCDLFIATLFPI